jgi:hypothetical protein
MIFSLGNVVIKDDRSYKPRSRSRRRSLEPGAVSFEGVLESRRCFISWKMCSRNTFTRDALSEDKFREAFSSLLSCIFRE